VSARAREVARVAREHAKPHANAALCMPALRRAPPTGRPSGQPPPARALACGRRCEPRPHPGPRRAAEAAAAAWRRRSGLGGKNRRARGEESGFVRVAPRRRRGARAPRAPRARSARGRHARAAAAAGVRADASTRCRGASQVLHTSLTRVELREAGGHPMRPRN
jgi:hypothetical protein